MRVFKLTQNSVTETDTLPEQLPENGFLWMAFARREFEVIQQNIQNTLERLCNTQIVDLHIADILNNQLSNVEKSKWES